MSETILKVEDLKTSFMTSSGEVQAVRGVSFEVHKGEILGIVGESGSGKSVTSMSILRLLADTARIKNGKIEFEGTDLTKVSDKQMREIRGQKIAMVFQDPMSSLNPLIPVGKQVAEMIHVHHPEMKRDELQAATLELFREVRIPEAEKRLKSYPHEFSGGMRQRVMIAMALGNIYGGKSADKSPNPDKLYGRILIAAIWIALIPVVGKYIILGISALLIFTVSNNFLIIAAFAACMVIFVFPLFLLGTVTPSLVKYSVDSLDDSGQTVGTLGAFNTVGSIIGTFASITAEPASPPRTA